MVPVKIFSVGIQLTSKGQGWLMCVHSLESGLASTSTDRKVTQRALLETSTRSGSGDQSLTTSVAQIFPQDYEM